MSGKTALLLGASGETGKEVLNYLVKTDVFTKIVCVVRRNIEVPSDPSDKSWNKIEQKIVNFEDLKGDIFENVDTAFCCLGTTRGKAGKEGSSRLTTTMFSTLQSILSIVTAMRFIY